jgi:endonuclease/exonuclease/phosphatase (EEP) superfamily protein YafD
MGDLDVSALTAHSESTGSVEDEASPAGPPPSRLSRLAPWVGPAATASLPWTWFVWRDGFAIFDLVAVLLPPMVIGWVALLLGIAALRRSPRYLLAVGSAVVFALVAIVLPWAPIDSDPPVSATTIMTANAEGPEVSGPAEAVLASLLDADTDVLVVAEVSPLLARMLREHYRYYALTYPDEENSPLPPAVGVFSRVPLDDVTVRPDGLPGLRMVVDGEGGPFALYAMHVPKAWFGASDFSTSFSGHRDVVSDLADAAEEEALPVVVAGDLNTPDRSNGYRRLTEHLDDAARAERWAGPTSVKSSLLWRSFALRIDHILYSAPWCAAGRGQQTLEGSDHRGVIAEVGPCPDDER